MPLLAVKFCCYFKNSEYLQKILEHFSVFDQSNLKTTMPEEMIKKFEISQILNVDYLEDKKQIDLPNYRNIIESFEGLTPLHIAIARNSYECVRLLLEETNIDVNDLTANNETSVILACKNSVSIEILESLLVSLRT